MKRTFKRTHSILKSTINIKDKTGTCIKCGSVKIVLNKRKDGYINWRCGISHQNGRQKIRSYYGISFEEYIKMLEKQKNLCAICHKKPKRKLHIDHNHKTGKVRGLLCPKCNQGLGCFYDNGIYIARAYNYLKK